MEFVESRRFFCVFFAFTAKKIGKDDGVQEGKIVLKAKNNQLKVVLPYQMEVLHGELGVNASLLQFHTRGGDNDLTPRKISVRNGFRVPIMVIDATLAADLVCLFSVGNKCSHLISSYHSLVPDLLHLV